MTITVKELYEATLRGESLLAKHALYNPDMPVFMLIGQDQLAADLVDKWAIQASVLVPSIDVGSKGAKKVDEAKAIAEAMREWPTHVSPV